MNEADQRFLMRALRNVQIKLQLRFKIVRYRLDVVHHEKYYVIAKDKRKPCCKTQKLVIVRSGIVSAIDVLKLEAIR